MARGGRHARLSKTAVRASSGGLALLAIAFGVLAVAGVAVVLGSALVGGTHVVSGGVAAVATATAEATATASAEPSVAPAPAPEPAHTPPPPPRAVIAWQPSHQGDTGYDGWREYEICGDIMERTVGALADFSHVRAWTLDHGLTGSNSYQRGPSNTKAFDVELQLANAGGADAFISLHNDGGAPSGVLGMCMPGDRASRALAEHLVASICASTGLPNRGIREERLYSLEADKNDAELRLLLEIGDNQKDRVLLEDPAKRQVIAEAIAEGVRACSW